MTEILVPIATLLMGLALGSTSTLAAFGSRVAVLETQQRHILDSVGKLDSKVGELNDEFTSLREAIGALSRRAPRNPREAEEIDL